MTPSNPSIEELLEIARKATLPAHYQWGRDAMEQFGVGKERAALALEPHLAALLERVKELEEGIAKIAEGKVGPEKEGHYLAHREAVRIVRGLSRGPVQEPSDEA